MGIVQLAVGLGLLTAASVLATASLRLPSAIDAVLAAYLVFSGLAIGIALALSLFHGLTVLGLILGAACALASATIAWVLTGKPALPLHDVVRVGRDALRDPPVLVLACAVTLALAYCVALAVATPANNHDSLWYHLARPAFWKQQHAVGYVEQANDARLDVFPPGAEIVSAWAMVLEGTERFASLFQLIALLATMVGSVGISRRLGLSTRQAVFGALLFASLPVVALQASTPLNDVAVCSYIVAAVYFALSRARLALGLGALALALAVATKGTAFVAVPLVAICAAVVRPRAEWLRIAGFGLGGLLLGSFWYAVNLVESGEPLPEFREYDNAAERTSGAAHVLGQLTRMMVDVVDPAGAVGRDRFLYVAVAAALVLTGAVVAVRRRPARGALVFLAAGALALVPLVVPPLHDWLLRGHQRLWLELDEPAIAFLAFEGEPSVPSPFYSWYGPLGLLLFLAAVPAVGRAIRRGTIRRGSIAFLIAPVWYLIPVVLALDYNIGHGRYLMPAVVVSAATWGVIVDVRPLAWFGAAAGAATLLLAFVHYGEKPAGITVLGGGSRPSVWGASRATVLGAWHVSGPFRVVDELAEAGDTVALRLRQDDVSYPYFGAALNRRVVFVGEEEDRGLGRADWLVVAPGLPVPARGDAWREVPSGVAGWRVLRRLD
jgi:hypothetical protein